MVEIVEQKLKNNWHLFIKGDEINFIDIDSFSWYKPTTVINLINRIQSDFSYWINLNLEDYVL